MKKKTITLAILIIALLIILAFGLFFYFIKSPETTSDFPPAPEKFDAQGQAEDFQAPPLDDLEPPAPIDNPLDQ